MSVTMTLPVAPGVWVPVEGLDERYYRVNYTLGSPEIAPVLGLGTDLWRQGHPCGGMHLTGNIPPRTRRGTWGGLPQQRLRVSLFGVRRLGAVTRKATVRVIRLCTQGWQATIRVR